MFRTWYSASHLAVEVGWPNQNLQFSKHTQIQLIHDKTEVRDSSGNYHAIYGSFTLHSNKTYDTHIFGE